MTNISRSHALYAVGDGYRIRLPRLEDGDEPAGGWFVRAGTVSVGSQAMLDEGVPLRVTVLGATDTQPELESGRTTTTVLPLRLDPDTKLFLVALLWCRPWLVDPTRRTPLPRTPEIAREALVVTDAHYELERFDTDPAFRDRLSARVGEHVKALRQKITERGLAARAVRLSDEVVASVLLEHAVDHPGRPGPAGRPRLVHPAGRPVVGALISRPGTCRPPSGRRCRSPGRCAGRPAARPGTSPAPG